MLNNSSIKDIMEKRYRYAAVYRKDDKVESINGSPTACRRKFFLFGNYIPTDNKSQTCEYMNEYHIYNPQQYNEHLYKTETIPVLVCRDLH